MILFQHLNTIKASILTKLSSEEYNRTTYLGTTCSYLLL